MGIGLDLPSCSIIEKKSREFHIILLLSFPLYGIQLLEGKGRLSKEYNKY